METVKEVVNRLLTHQQNYTSSITHQSQEREKNNCPFKKCDGSGIITSVVNGILYAKNCDCTEQKIIDTKIEKAISFANIPKEFADVKVNDFNCSIYKDSKAIELATNARKMTANYILNFSKYSELGKGLYFYSFEKGSGKTLLAIALGNALMNVHKVNVKFITTVELFAEIRKTYDKDSAFKESQLLDSLKQVEVLILDDIGTEKKSDWVNEMLYQMLNTRMTSKLITIFTSNVHVSQLKHDERIISRIEKMSLPIQMPEVSVRKNMAIAENEELVKALLSS